MDRAEWNELADDFEEPVCDIVASETNDQLRRFVRAARPLPKKPVLVDLGCGIGTFIHTFGRPFDKIIGVEYAPQHHRARAGRVRGRRRRRVADDGRGARGEDASAAAPTSPSASTS